MRIALVTDGIWPYVLGGMQKHSYYLCKYLAANGVQVHLFHYNDSSYDIGLLQYFSPQERAFIQPEVLHFRRSARWPGHYLYDSYRYSREAGKRIMADQKPYDFIYAKGFTAWYLLELDARQRRKLPPIGVNFHGFEMFQRPTGFKGLLQQVLLLRTPVRRICRRADVVFSYGGKITPLIVKLGVPGGKIVEMPTGVEGSTIAEGIMPTADITRFVFLGRYERRKGIEELHKAISLLDEAHKKKSEFHFIGPIPADRHRDDCLYHGAVTDRERLYHLLRGCDVLICPSWSEGMPNVILEAMSQGLAVIGTNTGATSTLVHHGTGWLLAFPEPAVLARVLATVIDLPRTELDHRKHNALRHVSAEFVWERIAPLLIAELQRRSSHKG